MGMNKWMNGRFVSHLEYENFRHAWAAWRHKKKNLYINIIPSLINNNPFEFIKTAMQYKKRGIHSDAKLISRMFIKLNSSPPLDITTSELFVYVHPNSPFSAVLPFLIIIINFPSFMILLISWRDPDIIMKNLE